MVTGTGSANPRLIDRVPLGAALSDSGAILDRFVRWVADTGLTPYEHQEQALGHTTIDFFPGERGEQAVADDKRVFEGAAIQNQEKSDFGAQGQVRWSLTTKVPLHDLMGVRIETAMSLLDGGIQVGGRCGHGNPTGC